MSWEYTEYTKPCPCGKGLVLVRVGSNDWGQSSPPDETILCPGCKEKDEAKKKAEEARNQRYRDLAYLAMEYFRNHYLDHWRSIFINDKYKKDLWSTATSAQVEKRSLASFYNHYSSKDSYIEGLVVLDNIPFIVNKLGIKDSKLEQMLEEPSRLHREIMSESLAAAYLYYKGR